MSVSEDCKKISDSVVLAFLINLLGALDCLEKPVDMGQLVDTIRRAQDHRARRLERRRMIDTGKLASLAQLAMGVAHELNNPLNVILDETGSIQDLVEGDQF